MINVSLQVLRTAFIALLLGIGLVLSAHGQVPSLIQYQGTLADEGAPVTETLSMTFTVYDASTGGSALWSETRTVEVENGQFSVLLGSVTDFGSLFTGAGERYLGVEVEGQGAFDRFRLASVAYALRAGTADGVAAGAVTAEALADGAAVQSVNGAAGALTLEGANGATVNQEGNVITISAPGGGDGSSGIQGLQNTDGALQIVDPNGPTATVNVQSGGITAEKLADEAVTALKLADGVVTTRKLADQSVTGAKLATGAVAGRNVQDGGITGAKIAIGAVGSAELLDGSVTADDLADAAVTRAKIAEAAITAAEIADDAVTGAAIDNNTITADDLADDAVDANGLADDAVLTGNIADNAVTAAKLSAGAVTTSKLLDGAVTGGKLASGTVVRSANGLTGPRLAHKHRQHAHHWRRQRGQHHRPRAGPRGRRDEPLRRRVYAGRRPHGDRWRGRDAVAQRQHAIHQRDGRRGRYHGRCCWRRARRRRDRGRRNALGGQRRHRCVHAGYRRRHEQRRGEQHPHGR